MLVCSYIDPSDYNTNIYHQLNREATKKTQQSWLRSWGTTSVLGLSTSQQPTGVKPACSWEQGCVIDGSQIWLAGKPLIGFSFFPQKSLQLCFPIIARGYRLVGSRLRIVVTLIAIDSVSHGQTNFHIVILSEKERERQESQQKSSSFG